MLVALCLHFMVSCVLYYLFLSYLTHFQIVERLLTVKWK
jgi:hypothetical protein